MINLYKYLLIRFLDQPSGAELDLIITLIDNNLQIKTQYRFA